MVGKFVDVVLIEVFKKLFNNSLNLVVVSVWGRRVACGVKIGVFDVKL